MADEHDLPSDSDEDDEDYVPEGADSDPVSEVESEGEAESGPEDENDENKSKSVKRKSTKSKGGKSKGKKRRKALEEKSADGEEEPPEKKELSAEEEKKRADSLWADFMKDTAAPSKSKSQTQTKPQSQESSNGTREKSPPLIRAKPEEKVKITKVFEFAGEEVKIEKEVSLDSAEARLSLSTAENSTKTSDTPTPAGKEPGRGRGARRGGGLGGISSVLGQLGKKAKISTLEKSKLDWDSFKRQENLQEEITTHNRGKDGYLERQDFLQRADLRQFEIEKQMRSSTRRSTR